MPADFSGEAKSVVNSKLVSVGNLCESIDGNVEDQTIIATRGGAHFL